MWYVIQVMGGRERTMCDLIERMVAHDLFEECFVPSYETEMKVGGGWHSCSKVLFPGYLIVSTSTVEAFRRALARVPEFTRLLSVGERFVALTDEERAWICAFTDGRTHTVPMSEGMIEGDHVVVTSGPLRGREALISSVNRRKSLAFIQIEMFGRTMTTRVGLSIVARHQKKAAS